MDPDFDDTSDYLEDFGLVANANGVAFKVILDAPDELVEIFSDRIVSRAFKMRFASNDAILNVGDVVIVDKRSYRVQKPPMRLFDGVFSEVEVEVVK